MDRAEFRVRARSLDAQLQRLAGEYEQLLADLRQDVAAGNALVDPEGTLDERLDLICFQLVTTGSVFARVELDGDQGRAGGGEGTAT